MISIKISFAAGIIHTFLSLVLIIVGFRVSSLFDEFAVKRNFFYTNWPLLTFLVFAASSFLFWQFLKTKNKQKAKVSSGLFVSVLLLVAPFIILYASAIFARLQSLQDIIR